MRACVQMHAHFACVHESGPVMLIPEFLVFKKEKNPSGPPPPPQIIPLRIYTPEGRAGKSPPPRSVWPRAARLPACFVFPWRWRGRPRPEPGPTRRRGRGPPRSPPSRGPWARGGESGPGEAVRSAREPQHGEGRGTETTWRGEAEEEGRDHLEQAGEEGATWSERASERGSAAAAGRAGPGGSRAWGQAAARGAPPPGPAPSAAAGRLRPRAAAAHVCAPPGRLTRCSRSPAARLGGHNKGERQAPAWPAAGSHGLPWHPRGHPAHSRQPRAVGGPRPRMTGHWRSNRRSL